MTRALGIACLSLLFMPAVAAAGRVDYRYAGVLCEGDAATNGIVCARQDARGYVLGISRTFVGVQRNKQWVLFRRNQGRATTAIASTTWFAFDRVECSLRPPSTVFCERADHVGYGVSISRDLVSVVRLSDGRSMFRKANR